MQAFSAFPFQSFFRTRLLMITFLCYSVGESIFILEELKPHTGRGTITINSLKYLYETYISLGWWLLEFSFFPFPPSQPHSLIIAMS